MSKRRQQMHGKTFGNIRWIDQPENHNWGVRLEKRTLRLRRAFEELGRAARRSAQIMAAMKWMSE